MKHFLTFYIIIICFFSHAAAQQNAKELEGVLTYMKRTMMFGNKMPQEKVYLHIDNTGYFKGETIWFKGYVVRSDNGKPTDMSHILYVELVNPIGDIVETRKLAIKNGSAYGDIKLDSIYGTGFYEVRAYTRYMTNWGSGALFSRIIPVFNSPKNDGDYSKLEIDQHSYRRRLPNLRNNEVDQTEATQSEDNTFRVRFFPEGGKLIKGLNSRVAFTVTDKNGGTVDIGGGLLNENKEVVSAINTQRNGRGVFELTPNGKPMYVRLADNRGHQHDFMLPTAEEQGVTMQMNTVGNDESVSAMIRSSEGMYGQMLGYTLMHNGKVYDADTMYARPATELRYERDFLQPGVNQLTVFDAEGKIQAERLFFICPKADAADSVVITSRNAFPKPCGKVVIDINTRPNADLSFSAIDAATMSNGREGNAMTYMLLSSEVRGYIEDPGYYFESDDIAHRKAADLLMMVQGWRRYNWNIMSGATVIPEGMAFNGTDKSQPIEDRLYLFGQLKQKRKKNTVDNVNMDVYLYNRKGQSLVGNATTDNEGNYAFALPEIDGEWKTIIKTQKDDKDANYYVGINRHFAPTRRFLSPNETQTIDLLKANLFNDKASKEAAEESNEYVPITKREHVIPTVVVKTKRRIYEGARAAWESEKEGQHFADMYYNAAEDNDMFADKGLVSPGLYEWLHMRNPFFGGKDEEYSNEMSGLNEQIALDEAYDMTASLGKLSADYLNEVDNIQESTILDVEDPFKGMAGAGGPSIFSDGLGYKNRPIIWILNNGYAGITHAGNVQSIKDFMVLQECNETMPVFIDEVKAVYVTEKTNAYKKYLKSSDLMGKKPVTVFVYTYFSMPQKVKGLRNTHFTGYNEPSTFEMDDYTKLPPSEDFRRTLYWIPNVKADAKGHATVEFFNNSSCHEMHVTCEGITPDGKIVVNE